MSARNWLRSLGAMLPAVALCACDAALGSVALSDPQKADWGFSSIDGMTTPADDATTRCLVVPAVDTASEARARCTFQKGDHVAATLGLPASFGTSLPISHVIVLMKENRSFDHLLGKLHERGQPGVEAIPPSYQNPGPAGAPVFPMHASTTCWPNDPAHQSAAVAACIDGGKMDGFVGNAASSTGTDGTFAISYYDAPDLPFYYWLATTYAIGDRHFAPVASGTYANRAYLVLGQSGGVVDTGIVYPSPATPSIFQLLINSGHTWRVYTDGSPLSGSLDWTAASPGVRNVETLLSELDAGTLPNVAFVDGKDNVEDDHPNADLQVGEAWLAKIYDHARKSPQWNRMALVWTYDEGGAFADHVPPPLGCVATEADAALAQRGPRVPLVVISPWAKRNYVSHTPRDHAAITRFIELLFDLPALSARDANSDALLDMFDFTCGRDLAVGAAPPPGTGGCSGR